MPFKKLSLSLLFSVCVFAHEDDIYRWEAPALLAVVEAIPTLAVNIPSIPVDCNWCATNEFDKKGSEAAQWRNAHAADILSWVIGFGLIPAITATVTIARSFEQGSLNKNAFRQLAFHALSVGGSVLGTAAVTDGVKRSAARERPWVYYNRTDVAAAGDEDVSFFSGHTSLSVAIATTTVIESIVYGKPGANIEYASLTTLPLAGFVGYLRVAAAKHWPSDVMTGAGVGIAISILNFAMKIGLLRLLSYINPAPSSSIQHTEPTEMSPVTV